MDDKVIDCRDIKSWRAWLEKNHLKESKIALLVHKKHTGKGSMSHREAMEQAICFGWIDTTIKSLNEDTFIRRFARRTDKSKWSDNTLSYAKRLLAEGQMSPEGIKRYKEGLTRPTHDHGIPKDPDVPLALKKALKEKGMWKKFEKMAPSYRRTFLRWLLHAKGEDTKKKRIGMIVKMVEQGKKLGA